MLKHGDKVRIISDWIVEDSKNLLAVVDKLQTNGIMKCARIKWLGRNPTKLVEEYGIVFPIDELKKV